MIRLASSGFSLRMEATQRRDSFGMLSARSNPASAYPLIALPATP